VSIDDNSRFSLLPIAAGWDISKYSFRNMLCNVKTHKSVNLGTSTNILCFVRSFPLREKFASSIPASSNYWCFFTLSVSFRLLYTCLMFSWSCAAPTAATGHTKTVDSPDNYAWIEAINSPVNIYMRPGMYTGPTVQVSPNFYILHCCYLL
jgi:hypothetical protein